LQNARREVAFLQRVLDAIPSPVYLKDLDGRYRVCNEAFARFLGRDGAEIIGRTVQEITAEDTARRHEEIDRQLLAGFRAPLDGSGWVEYESDLASAAHEMTHGISRKAVMKDESGAALGVVGTVVDVTKLKAAQDGYRRAQKYLSAIIEFLPDPTFVVDAQHRVTAWNKAMEAMTDTPGDEVLGTTGHAQAFYGFQRPMLVDVLLDGVAASDGDYEQVCRDGDGVVAEAFVPHLYGGRGGYIWGKAALLYDEEGQGAGAVQSLRDVTDRRNAESALANAKRFAEELLDRIAVPSLVIGRNHEVLLWNRSLADLTGVQSADTVGTDRQWRGFYETGRPVLADLVLEQDAEQIARFYPNAVPSHTEPGGWRDEGWLQADTRERRYVVFEALPVRIAGRIEAVIQTTSDLTEIKMAAEAVEESMRKYQLISERSLVGIYVTTMDRFAYVNPKMTEIFGYTREEFLAGMGLLQLVVPADRRVVRMSVRDRLEGAAVGTAVSFRGRKKTGQLVYLEEYGAAAMYEGERAIIGSIMDVTARKTAENRTLAMSAWLEEVNAALKQANEKLEVLSSTDSLTGLANRRAFDTRMRTEWLRAVREHCRLSLVVADVDFFKAYNDTYGHPEGDECLKRIAEVLGRAARRPGDLAARFGGEEFVLLLPNTEPAGAEEVAKRVLAEVQALSIAHPGSCVSAVVTVSLGVASMIPARGDHPQILISAADDALYRAKSAGRNRVEAARC